VVNRRIEVGVIADPRREQQFAVVAFEEVTLRRAPFERLHPPLPQVGPLTRLHREVGVERFTRQPFARIQDEVADGDPDSRRN
jgi:hypothetical protein